MKKRNIVGYLFLFITIFSYVMLLFYLNKLNIIPLKYCYFVSFIEFFLIMFCLIFNKVRNAILNYISIFLIIGVLVINCLGLYYVRHFDSFLDSSFTGDIISSNSYYVVTSKNNIVSNIDEVSVKSTFYYFGAKNKVLDKLGKYNYSLLEEYDDFFINSKDTDNYLLIEKNIYNFIIDSIDKYNGEDFKVIYTFDVSEILPRNEEVKDIYNVLITGKDFSNLNDYNLLVTINTNTHKVVLTSIQRDLSIPAYGYTFKENVNMLTLLGDNVVKESIGNFFGVKVDYIINLYTDNFVNIVDKIGGIEFCSDTTFVTTHALVLGTYNDSLGKKFYVKKGCQHLNGIEALTVARERKAFKTADRKRQENCRKILISIVEKIVSTSSLLNYTSILDSFSGLYTTDMNRTVATEFIRSLITDGNNYEVFEYLADGYNTIGVRNQGRSSGYVTYPNEDVIKTIRAKIQEVMNEK